MCHVYVVLRYSFIRPFIHSVLYFFSFFLFIFKVKDVKDIKEGHFHISISIYHLKLHYIEIFLIFDATSFIIDNKHTQQNKKIK